jgi:hypothetical protein
LLADGLLEVMRQLRGDLSRAVLHASASKLSLSHQRSQGVVPRLELPPLL